MSIHVLKKSFVTRLWGIIVDIPRNTEADIDGTDDLNRQNDKYVVKTYLKESIKVKVVWIVRYIYIEDKGEVSTS